MLYCAGFSLSHGLCVVSTADYVKNLLRLFLLFFLVRWQNFHSRVVYKSIDFAGFFIVEEFRFFFSFDDISVRGVKSMSVIRGFQLEDSRL